MKMFRLLGQAMGIGLAVALVEEVLFRSWLQEEIAVDLGFHRAVFLSALAFSLIHWYVYKNRTMSRCCIYCFM
jgi:membrane protease YdiL (CAAX protease family)